MKILPTGQAPSGNPHKDDHGNFLTFSIFLKVLLPACLVVVATVAGVTTYLTREKLEGWADRRGHSALRKDIRRLEAFLRLPGRLLKSLTGDDFPRLIFDVKFKNMQKIREKREKALATGLLIQESGDFVPGAIRYKDRTIPIKLRLRGDMTDHLQGDKWSFRVRVRGDNALFGLRRFSIQNPSVRGYHGETLFNETLRHVGVLAPGYFFVNVTINGRPIGLMALEEHFSKELLEAQGRRESVILKFDESLLWAFRASKPRRLMLNNDMDPFYYYKNAPIDVFNSGKINKSSQLAREYSVAAGLLRGFVNGDLPVSEAFDEVLMGRFLAVAQLWGSNHAEIWHNMRFYFNPITSKLEPIGFNGEIQGRIPPRQPCGQEGNTLSSQLLRDPKVYRVCKQTISDLAHEIKNGKFLSRLKTIEQKYLPTLRKEFFLLEGFPWDELLDRADYFLLTGEYDPKAGQLPAKEYSTTIHAFHLKNQGEHYLEILNAVPYPVEIRSIRWIPNGAGPALPFRPTSPLEFPLSLPATPLRELPRMSRVQFQPPPELSRYSLEVSAAILNSNNVYKIKAKPYFSPIKKNPIPALSKQELLSKFPFITEALRENALRVTPGKWQVHGTIALPDGHSLAIPANTTLQFCSKEDGLIARGPLYFQGEVGAPVVLEGLSGQGCDGWWQGVTVLGAHAPSRWSHVTIRNTSGVRHPDWEITGSVTFYRSDVEISNSTFRANKSEDALNIVNSRFHLKDVSFYETASDAIDIDFSEGIIEGGLFQDIGKAGGGDAIDTSGSRVTVKGTRFLNINDKALSVGEKSTMTAANVVIESAVTGAASKDGSHLEISNSTIRKAKNVGLMAYRKKREFGPGSIDARGVSFVDTAVSARVQKGSKITMDGEQVETEDVNVEELYKTIMKPSQRK